MNKYVTLIGSTSEIENKKCLVKVIKKEQNKQSNLDADVLLANPFACLNYTNIRLNPDFTTGDLAYPRWKWFKKEPHDDIFGWVKQLFAKKKRVYLRKAGVFERRYELYTAKFINKIWTVKITDDTVLLYPDGRVSKIYTEYIWA